MLPGEDVLGDNDGVVDQQAEHDDEPEHRDEVHRHVEDLYMSRNVPRNEIGQADRDPERDAHLEKEAEHEDDQQETEVRVAHHEIEALADETTQVACWSRG